MLSQFNQFNQLNSLNYPRFFSHSTNFQQSQQEYLKEQLRWLKQGLNTLQKIHYEKLGLLGYLIFRLIASIYLLIVFP